MPAPSDHGQEDVCAKMTTAVGVMLDRFGSDLEPLLQLKNKLCGRLWTRYRVPRQIVEDLLQDALLGYLGVRSTVRDPIAWVGKAVERRAISWAKRAKREKPLGSESARSYTVELGALEAKELISLLLPRQRLVFEHLYLRGETLQETAQHLSMTSEAVRQLAKRGRARLRLFCDPGDTFSHPRSTLRKGGLRHRRAYEEDPHRCSGRADDYGSVSDLPEILLSEFLLLPRGMSERQQLH